MDPTRIDPTDPTTSVEVETAANEMARLVRMYLDGADPRHPWTDSFLNAVTHARKDPTQAPTWSRLSPADQAEVKQLVWHATRGW